jgi:hypothetical protein
MLSVTTGAQPAQEQKKVRKDRSNIGDYHLVLGLEGGAKTNRDALSNEGKPAELIEANIAAQYKIR